VTPRERILSVFRGETPDAVPCMLDLSHWYTHHFREPWDLSAAYEEPDHGLLEYHRRTGAGFYIANLAAFYTTHFPDDVQTSTRKHSVGGAPAITWRLETAHGAIERTRVWEERTYAWGMHTWGIRTAQDLAVFTDAMARRSYTPRWDRHAAWTRAVGDNGIVYISPGYSAMGHLLNYWMGIERAMYATVDMADTVHAAVDAVNANGLELIDLLAGSPAEVVLMGDNFSGDVQPPRFFDTWSRDFYTEAVRRLHRAGKRVMVHIDGRLRGAIGMIRNTGADGGDAITPTPMGDLTPAQCRDEAGPDFILSGGVSPDVWLPNVPVEVFRRKVLDWLALRQAGPRLIAAAGDQVPPGADEDRIRLMVELVEAHGRY
jgi:hypothetical protein